MKKYTFDQLSISAKNNAYCEWLSILSYDDALPDTSMSYFAEMMKGDACYDVDGDFVE